MAKKRAATYSFRFRNARGFSKLRYALTFDIYYGKRRVIRDMTFPRTRKRVAQRRELLERIIVEIETRRLRLLERARRKRQKAREKILKKKARQRKKAETRRRRAREKKIVVNENQRLINEAQEVEIDSPKLTGEELSDREYFRARKELLNFKDMRYEEPVTLRSASISDALIISLKPTNHFYFKEQINKRITIENQSDALDLAILNMTLKPEHQIPVSADTMDDDFTTLVNMLFAHVYDYWKEMNRHSELFIFRLKFSYEEGGREQGISLLRNPIITAKELQNVFTATFLKLRGNQIDRFGRPIVHIKNYLADKRIWITGFTLEAADYAPLQ